MARTRDLEPEPALGGLPVIVLLSVDAVVSAVLSVFFGNVWLLALGIPGFIFVWVFAQRKWLLLRAMVAYKRRKIIGVFITSESAAWNEYIQSHWPKDLLDRLAVLNWSQRWTWKKSLAKQLFETFSYSNRNLVPSVLLLRGLRDPLTFRFYFSLRDLKHGDYDQVRGMEERLFKEVEKTRSAVSA